MVFQSTVASESGMSKLHPRCEWLLRVARGALHRSGVRPDEPPTESREAALLVVLEAARRYNYTGNSYRYIIK